MSRYEDNKYPLEPPYEDEVVFYESTTVRVTNTSHSSILKESREKPRCVPYAAIPSTFEWSPSLAHITFATSATTKVPTFAVSVAV